MSGFRILPRIPNGPKSCWLLLQNHSEPDLALPCLLLPPAAPVHLISYQDDGSSPPPPPPPLEPHSLLQSCPHSLSHMQPEGGCAHLLRSQPSSLRDLLWRHLGQAQGHSLRGLQGAIDLPPSIHPLPYPRGAEGSPLFFRYIKLSHRRASALFVSSAWNACPHRPAPSTPSFPSAERSSWNHAWPVTLTLSRHSHSFVFLRDPHQTGIDLHLYSFVCHPY